LRKALCRPIGVIGPTYRDARDIPRGIFGIRWRAEVGPESIIRLNDRSGRRLILFSRAGVAMRGAADA